EKVDTVYMLLSACWHLQAPKIQPPKSTDIAVYLGKSMTLDCLASGKPPAQISWILPDRTFVREVRTVQTLPSPISLLQNGTLIITSANFSSKGDYKCIASNAAGADTITYHLHVAALPPSIGEGAVDTVVIHGIRNHEGDYTCYAKNKLGKDERKVSVKVGPNAPKIKLKSQFLMRVKFGESATLSCQATGEPIPRITWISPRSDVIPMSSERFQIMDDGTLVVKKVRLADEGKYTCVARNSAGDDVKNMKLEVEPEEPFINGMKGKSTGKVWGVSYQAVLLDCRAEGKPEPRVWWVTPYGHSLSAPYLGGRFQASITWTLPNGLVLDKPQTVGRVSFLVNGTLQLRQVATFDKGTYICKAFNSFGSSALSYPVAVMVFPPRITSPLHSITRVNRGSPVTLNCVATGIPKPDISWTLPGRTTLVPHNRFTVQGGIHMTEEGSLVIQNPVLMNSGIYKCNAKNALGTDFKSTYLQVV
uniref:Ig-like domain-containing protein n=1 Tax=Echeneis naucrates TaxID=173247 RepID=A0A665T3D7_ECHNA